MQNDVKIPCSLTRAALKVLLFLILGIFACTYYFTIETFSQPSLSIKVPPEKQNSYQIYGANNRGKANVSINTYEV